MGILGIGGSVAGTVEADAIVVKSFDELKAAADEGLVKGKIVVYNQPWKGYGPSVAYRTRGMDEASKLGALAVLVRSVTPYSQYTPHTGELDYKGGNITKIPAACLTVEDAEMLDRMQARNQTLRIRLHMTSDTKGTCSSHNTVFELTGSKFPEQVVLLSGHLDSWDVGQGAMDDGAGVASMWAALTALKNLGLRPKRTIRVVAWTDEEMGLLGAGVYYTRHNNKGAGNETFVFVSESDEGAFKPTSRNAKLEFAGTKKQQRKFQNYVTLMNIFGIPMSVDSVPGAALGDVGYWGQDGVPGTIYVNMDTYDYYFRFHHTNADMMTLLKHEDLDYTAAVFAVIAHLVADNPV